MSISCIVPTNKLLKISAQCLPTIANRLTGSKTSEKSKVELAKNDFIPVYRLPNIWVAGLINKVKIYQLATFGIMAPITYCLQATELLSSSWFYTFTSVGFASTIATFSVGQLFTNLVGVVYTSKDQSRVKISYIDFKGRRRDNIVPQEQIEGVTKLPVVPWSLLKLVDHETQYKISLRFGEILITPLYKRALNHDPDV